MNVPVRIICNSYNISRAKLYRLLSKHCKKDDSLEKEIRRIAYEHPEYGYRRIHSILRNNGFNVNHKKVYRIYTQLDLQRIIKISKKLKIKSNSKLTLPTFPAHVWSADFVDVFIRKRKLRILFLIDDFTRILHGVCVSFSITASTVQKVIEKSIYTYSRPRILRTDNGPEFREKHLNLFLKNSRIKHEFIDKGKPYQNGFSESLNARFKDECLGKHDLSLLPVKTIKDIVFNWVREYNFKRPHSSLNYIAPVHFHLSAY